MRLAAAALAASFALPAALCPAAAINGPNPSHLHAGDRLLYDLTIEEQVHGIPPAHGQGSDVTKDGAGIGTEAVSVLRVAQDGSASARVSVDFAGIYDRKPVRAHQTFDASIAPNGELQAGGMGQQAQQAFTIANITAREFAGMALHVGQVWHSSERLPQMPGMLRVSRKIVGRTMYRGLPTFIVQTVGNGAFRQTLKGQVVDSAISVTGTSYYDSRDQLFVGAAMRRLSLTSFPKARGAHVNATSRLNVMLRDFSHAAASSGQQPPSSVKKKVPLPRVKASASPGAGETPAASPASAPSGASPGPTASPSSGF